MLKVHKDIVLASVHKLEQEMSAESTKTPSGRLADRRHVAEPEPRERLRLSLPDVVDALQLGTLLGGGESSAVLDLRAPATQRLSPVA